ncbi:eukaryotic aspartyl protease [Hirsutella rhossiliensis]|uniref:Eukaryotic aspartyl protease domain-containing protein n=1 Tax=Hirsutella rhossiliensis TaxID=111463 RepID=A0A9P8MUF5_9HYPO|nr:eukaryotic aspartyl protease domain-containing protein [Hirsutella rhossiliensis]KAH0959412.1 eukaryotic aspartyl protease domain-containing protein [Hirsutella rhossiliensis]
MRPHHVLSGLLALNQTGRGAVVDAAASAPSTSLDCSNCAAVPAVWNGFGYLFNVTVGGQLLTVLSDWTWASLFVRSGRCLNRFDPSLCVGTSGQAWFNERQSPTFENSSLPQSCWPITAFAPNFTVDYATDEVCVGDICNPGTILQLSDFPYPAAAIPTVPFAGIYGMAPVTPGLGEELHPASYQSWNAGKLGPRFGWHSCATLSSSKPCLGGEAKVVLGGTDTSLYNQSEVHEFAIRNPSWLGEAFYPLTPPRNNYWSTELTGNWIRSTGQQESPNFAIAPNDSDPAARTLGLLDEGSEGLAAPLSLKAYRWLVDQVNGTLAPSTIVQAILAQGSSGFNMAHQDWFTVPCNGTGSFPELVYELEGRANYTISPDDYVVKLNAGATQPPVCYLGINVWKYGRVDNGDARVLLLGGAFLKRLYVILDFERLSFSFAPLRGSIS